MRKCERLILEGEDDSKKLNESFTASRKTSKNLLKEPPIPLQTQRFWKAIVQWQSEHIKQDITNLSFSLREKVADRSDEGIPASLLFYYFLSSSLAPHPPLTWSPLSQNGRGFFSFSKRSPTENSHDTEALSLGVCLVD